MDMTDFLKIIDIWSVLHSGCCFAGKHTPVMNEVLFHQKAAAEVHAIMEKYIFPEFYLAVKKIHIKRLEWPFAGNNG